MAQPKNAAASSVSGDARRILEKAAFAEVEWKQSLVSHFMHDTLPLPLRAMFGRQPAAGVQGSDGGMENLGNWRLAGC
jgi:hypothetical protein